MASSTYFNYRDGKRYVFTDPSMVNGKIVFQTGLDDETTLPADAVEIAKQPDTLFDVLSRAGYSPERITEIVKEKYDNFERLDSIAKSVTYQDYLTKENKTSTDGSLVSNSAQALKNNTTYQNLKIEIEKNRNVLMSEHNELLKKSLQISDYNLVMQSQILGALNDLTTATKNQNLTTGTINVNPSVHVDTTAIAESTKTIADATVALSESATVQKEHYDFLKNGSDSLKDTNGNKIVPQEVQAKINAEKLIEQEDLNKTTFDDIAGFVNEALGVVEDGVDKVLGSTDGFDLDFNPIAYIDEILMTDFIEHKDKYYPENKA